ncbi:DUF4239 domain-containing protein [Microvirga flavescens]|uniref:bestrophin-like domain n=1 Tax=Microvirga flavescens TaxID=2249811 RepID=UPI0013002508|nr:DUF4239 domain-containing protein [Microvirga flavescens]
MIFDRWLDMPVWGIFVSLAALLTIFLLFIHWLSFGKRCRTTASSFTGIVAPFFGSVAILFALLTGFLASDVWERSRRAADAIFAERDGLLALNTMTIASAADMRNVRQAIRDYIRILIEDEWPRMANQESSPRAEEALLSILSLVSDPKVGIEAGQAAQGAFLDTVLSLRKARSVRLSLSDDQTDRTKWTVVIFLALMTQVAIAMVHLERPRAQVAALSIFSIAVVVALGLIATRERPFDGALGYSAEPLADALATMVEPSPKP